MDRIENLCVEKGMRMTDQRRVVARVLSQAQDHPDVEELYRRAHEVDPHISIATVYRTVRLFEEAGIIARHDFQGGRSRYEEAPDHHHDHLIDMKTGQVVEFMDEEIERLAGRHRQAARLQAGGPPAGALRRADRGRGQGVSETAAPAKRLFIKTYGCQMNVYDSERMADVLRPLGYAMTDAPDGADLVVLNTCHIREKAAEKLYSDLGRLKPMKSRNARHAGDRRRLRRPGGGLRDHHPCAGGGFRGRPAVLSPPARTGGQERARHRRAADGRLRPGGQVRRLARRPRRHRPHRLPDGAGGLRQVLHLLRRALHAGRRILPPGERHPRRGAATGRSGGARSHPVGPERQRLQRSGR